jgi:ADP-ribose pyrophosphatase
MEKKLSSRLLYEGRNFSFKTDEVELQNGRKTRRDIVDHPGAVAVLPVLLNGNIVLVRQYRYAVKKNLLEIPAGTIEKDETPLNCAIRELREETGYEAGKMQILMRCYMAPGYSSELIYFYVATGLKMVNSVKALDEVIIVKAFELKEVLSMIKDNTIEDAKTIAGVLTYLTYNTQID